MSGPRWKIEPSLLDCYRRRSVNDLLEHVGQSIRDRKLLRRGDAVLVAVSGGLDSMALLHLLHSLAPANRWRLCVAHFNHQLRGRSSDADERLVRRMARRLGLKCICASGGVKGHAARAGISIEMAARELRHEFLARTARQLKIRAIALAHHADDQVESFFLRLLRGAGGEGLTGMKWRSPSPVDHAIQLIRPLLEVAKAELEMFTREKRVRFREDASNAALDMQRNRIRHELLPLLRRHYQPAVSKVVLRVMEIVGAEADVVTEAARAFLQQKDRTLTDWPLGVQRRVLQLQLQAQGLTADFELIESLRLGAGKLINAAPRVFVKRDEAGQLRFSAAATATFDGKQTGISLGDMQGTAKFDGITFRWRFARGRGTQRFARQPGREFFDAAKVGSSIVLRHWRPGDRFQPSGMNTPIKLQDWFTNQKVPQASRHNLVIATTADGTIFWVEDQRIDERFKLTSATKEYLVWNWIRA